MSRRAADAHAERCARSPPYSFRRKRASPLAFPRRRSGVAAALPVSSLSFPLKRKNSSAAIGPVPATRTSCPRVGDAPEPADDAREGVEQRGGLVAPSLRGSSSGRSSRGARARGETRRTRRREIGRTPSRRGSRGPRDRPCTRRTAPRPRTSRACLAPGGARARLLDDARPFVPERERERKLRVAAPRDLEVGPAGERRGTRTRTSPGTGLGAPARPGETASPGPSQTSARTPGA